VVRANRREKRRYVLAANVHKGRHCSSRWRRKIRRKEEEGLTVLTYEGQSTLKLNSNNFLKLRFIIS